jgi:uncharacterized protein (TIGR03083 family)
MLAIDYRSHVRTNADRLLAAAASGLAPSVPGCPDWTVGDVVGHVGRIHHWVAAVIESGNGAPERPVVPTEPAALLDWARGGADKLLIQLDRIELDSPCWTWAPSHQTGAFWLRRMAQEVAVHRFDAQNAHGVAEPIDPELAVDGIDEFAELWLEMAAGRATEPGHLLSEGQSIHLHATDIAGEWILVADSTAPGGVRVERSHGKGTVAVRGSASDLLLLLWRRLDLGADAGRFEVFGDGEVFTRFIDMVKI